MVTPPKYVVSALWKAMSIGDWEGIKPLLADDCIHYDAPIGPRHAIRGPENIVKLLQLALGSLASYAVHDGRIVAEGDTVMLQHSERYTWKSGETVLLPFASVHTVREGRITLWADYWDFRTLMDVAPTEWIRSLQDAAVSWKFDASGIV
jgi:limonene-1,2-epoxide hydrolase